MRPPYSASAGLARRSVGPCGASPCSTPVTVGRVKCYQKWAVGQLPRGVTTVDAKMVEARGAKLMIFGAHVIVYSKDATADRAFFKKVLGFSSVDAGGGWLIFALPPAEVAVHPAEVSDRHELFFVCADLKAEITALKEKGVKCSEV